MKYVLLMLLALFACGAPPSEQEEQDVQDEQLGELGQGMSAKRYLGWKFNDVWEHRRCDMQSIYDQCAMPSATTSGPNPWRRSIIAPVESTPVPPGFDLRLSREFATAYYSNTFHNPNWEWVVTTQQTASNLAIVSDETIYAGTPPNATINVSSIANVACTSSDGDLMESLNGSAFRCRQITVWLDVGAFTSWVNLWATSNNQRMLATDSLLRHFVGVAMGLGSHDAGDTPMRRRLSRSQSPIEITSYEKCLLNSVSFNDPSFVDPWFGMYANNCS